ncbi:nuclear mitotic apparatus protein 1 isoform X2 [Rana temporaria]|uniref:nuclear mitotic apparatus protein 1 isoform X2 n=1 Tax=Rana temporaria TaxID=8407 RepID=UPI001AAC9D1E|nr:nuclear mitotic apparatus protein 1 isoform X2 [Rana temporaria]
MALQGTLMESLLAWVNSLKVDDPIERLSQLQDLNIIIKIVNRLNGSSEEHPPILQKPPEERLAFLQKHCRCGSKAENLVQWERIVHGENSDLEICKILVLLFYVSNMKCKNAQDWESFDHKTQTNLASILRFIMDNEEDLSHEDKLIRFLQKKARVFSSESGSSSDEIASPNVSVRKSQVRFLELHKVASSSSLKSVALDAPSSPMSEVLHMPQFQIRRLRKQLVEGRDLRDELELELSETRKRLAEKEAQIFLMQQKIERLKVLNEKQADQQEPRELEELREKNESLMIRLRDALKQCQDMKTDRNQLERKNDQLSEENGDLSYKVRDLSSRLAQLQDALNETTEEHEQSMTGWQQQQSQLQNDLNAAITEKKLLEEHNQILQGKISTLEDQLKKMVESEETQKGESMGDVLRLENLQQEVTLLNSKSTELQAQITQLEEQKTTAAAEVELQRSRFESEKLQLQDIVTNLQTSLSEISFQKEKQDQEARVQEERLTCQITTLKLEITKLKASLAQKDEALASLQREVEDEKRERGQLMDTLQKQEESSRKNIEQLGHQVDHLSGSLTISEGKSTELTEKLNGATQKMTSLEQERDKIAGERDSAFKAFDDYKIDKEEQLQTLSQTCQTLKNDHQQSLASVEDLKRGKAELASKVEELDATISGLVAKCQHLDTENDAQSKSHTAVLESLKTQLAEQEAKLKIYEQKVSGMELMSEENGHIKDKLLSLEDMVKNLEELLENEKKRSALLENETKRNSILEGDVKSLCESRDQTIAELAEEKAATKRLESQLCQMEEEHGAKSQNLQDKLSETSDIIKQREEEIEKLTKEMGRWKDIAENSSQVEKQIESLKIDYKEVCQQLEVEKSRVLEMEAKAKTDMSSQLEKFSHLESELSAARTQLEMKETTEKNLLQSVHSAEEKLRLAQETETEQISQLEKSRSNAAQDLALLSKELSEEKQKKEELESTLRKFEEQKSERILSLESEITSMEATLKEQENETKALSTQLELLRKELEESNLKHQQKLEEKDNSASLLREEKEKAIADLKAEQTHKLEADAQLQKSVDVHKSEFSALQNKLSRSLDLITLKESELEKLSKEVAARDEALLLEKQSSSKLHEEVTRLKVFEEQAGKHEEEVKHFKETIKATESEITALKETIDEKENKIQRLGRDIQEIIQENASIRENLQALENVVNSLESRVKDLEGMLQDRELRMNLAHKEAAEARLAASKNASSSEQWQRALQALESEIEQERQKTSELAKQLKESQSLQTEKESSLEALKIELFHKVQELEQSQKALNESSKELSRVMSSSQDEEKSLAKAKEQVSKLQEEIEKKTGQVESMQEELKNVTAKLATNEKNFLEAKESLERESTKSDGLETQLKLVQEKLEVSVKELTQKQSAIDSLNADTSSYKQEADKQSSSVLGLQKKLSSQDETIAKLEQDIKTWQEKCSKKEEEMSAVQQQLANAQHALEELTSLKGSHEEMKTEQTRRESQYKEELLKNQKMSEGLKTELEKTKSEVASLLSLKESLSQKEATLETLQKESNDNLSKISKLQEENKRLSTENKSLSQASDQSTKKTETELSEIQEKHHKEIESLQQSYEKTASESKQQVDELSQKLEAVTSKYDHTKSKVLDERQKFQEEKQKLLAQVEQLEATKKDHAEQVQELNKQISQQEKTIRSQQQKLKKESDALEEEVEKKQRRLVELEKELKQQTTAAEHYKLQSEKCKIHYDAKKELNDELSDKLQAITREQEHLHKENEELKKESERINKELQLSLLQAKEAEQNCKTLTSQVRTLEAQVEYADRQLRDMGKFQVTTDTLKSREARAPTRVTRSRADVSTDSLEMSDEDENPMNSTRKNGRTHQEPSSAAAQTESPEPLAPNRLPKKVESLESLYFTPIPTARAQSKLDGSVGSIADFSLDSSKKTRSARRRTTQVINITMTKRTKEEKETEPESANSSFYSLRSGISLQALNQQSSTRQSGRPQPAISAPTLTSLPSQESLVKRERASSDDSLNNSGLDALLNLPGYRSKTRSSSRLSQTSGRSSFYVSTCQDEPDPLEDWNRIAELQQRNRTCPPHLKTSYPVESRPSLSAAITDEEMKTGDPKETLRRATLLPSQIQIHEPQPNSRRTTLSSTGTEHSSAGGGITTRQKMKRVSEESHYGPDTPETKKMASCFPRPMTPKDKPESRRMSTAESKASVIQQPSRRQPTGFSILNTPKKLGSNFLKRGINKKSTPKSTPQGGGSTSGAGKSPRLQVRKSPGGKSPRAATAKSPKTTSKVTLAADTQFFERKKSRNK